MRIHRYRTQVLWRIGLDSFIRASDSGLTLLEALVVVTIVAIVMAIASPAWNSFLNVRNLTTAQDQALQLMRQAQAEAIRHRIVWEVNFREINGIVQGTTHANHILPTEASWQPFNLGVRIDTQETTVYRNRTTGIYRIQFDHQGHVNGQLGKVTFMGANDGRTKRCVFVSNLLGIMRRGESRPAPGSSGEACR
jgi:prepilin-type N-terminal cleavage/methylation domain-containing protein